MECCSIFSDEELLSIVGVTNAEGPPVPIPNTEVKLCSGENTWLEAARENSSMPTRPRKRKLPRVEIKNPNKFGGVAQLGEHLPCKQGVMGSNPIISTSPSDTPQANYEGS